MRTDDLIVVAHLKLAPFRSACDELTGDPVGCEDGSQYPFFRPRATILPGPGNVTSTRFMGFDVFQTIRPASQEDEAEVLMMIGVAGIAEDWCLDNPLGETADGRCLCDGDLEGVCGDFEDQCDESDFFVQDFIDLQRTIRLEWVEIPPPPTEQLESWF